MQFILSFFNNTMIIFLSINPKRKKFFIYLIWIWIDWNISAYKRVWIILYYFFNRITSYIFRRIKNSIWFGNVCKHFDHKIKSLPINQTLWSCHPTTFNNIHGAIWIKDELTSSTSPMMLKLIKRHKTCELWTINY